jgi:DNA-binding transcriptional LysR family regulator
MEHMDLLALADFNLVARHGGFGRAARAAGRPKATLSRRVAELEESLGLRLFERGARALKLTEEGQAFYERTRILLAELEETAATIGSGAEVPRGGCGSACSHALTGVRGSFQHRDIGREYVNHSLPDMNLAVQSGLPCLAFEPKRVIE